MILNFSINCKPKIVPVVIGESRIVGKIVAGVVTFEPNEQISGSYFIVTGAFLAEKNVLRWDLKIANMEIERLRRLLEKK